MVRPVLLAAFLGLAAADSEVERLLAAIRSVGPEGVGSEEASRAWKALVERGPEALFPTLGAFEGADPRAANWLRSAVDAIASKAPPEAKQLEAFVLETRRDGRSRRLAYEWLSRVDPTAPGRLLPGMLGDPERELRRDAVARGLGEAEKLLKEGDREGAGLAFRRLFASARDRDQVDAVAKRLQALGIEADLRAHFGFIERWILLASFDNTEMKGFDLAYDPERKVDLGAVYAGKGGKPARRVECSTADPEGKVDLNAVLGKEMGAVAYAFAAIDSPSEGPAELRVGTNNAVKIFLNGREVFFRNEYHHGMKMDQYPARVELRKGRNEILLKICQNEQKDDWAQSWSFQARLCDALGGAVPRTIVTEAAGR